MAHPDPLCDRSDACFIRRGLGPYPIGRREFLQQATLGFGTAALAFLLEQEGFRADESPRDGPGGLDLLPRPGHFPPRARSVIMLMQVGGPSQMDLFDPKSELNKRDGQALPGDVEVSQPVSGVKKLMGCPFPFRRYGQCAMEMSQLLPAIGSVADEMCLVRSMVSDNNNHSQAIQGLMSGKVFAGRPSVGSWVGYALGTENQNLPAFVVLRDPTGYDVGGAMMWQNGWLPALFQGTEIQSRGAPVLDLYPAVALPEGIQRNNLVALARLNEERRRLYPRESELDARIRNYELAARMQLHAEAVLKVKRETAATRRLYGLDDPVTENFGTRCLIARRLVESGVRFVQVTPPIKSGPSPWDHHHQLKSGLEAICPQVDLPTAGLIRDLKQRGLLDTTIVLWTGEFGRLPVSQATESGDGRDHNRHAFSLLLAGGGFKAGHVHGATDDFSYQVVDGRVSCPDLLATILNQLGLDHTRLKYLHHGREESLTDPAVSHARVAAELLDQPAGNPARRGSV